MVEGLEPGLWSQIRWPFRLTRAALWAERLSRAFWPFASLCAAALAALGFGLDRGLAVEVWWITHLGLTIALAASAVLGLRRFRPPALAEVLARLDRDLPGQPIAALMDRQALGEGDEGARALWQAHRARMAARLTGLRAVPPAPDLARADPFALRLAATVALAVALLFGTDWRLPLPFLPGIGGPGAGAAAAIGPAWEGWAEPPPHTGLPRLYLPDQTAETLVLPTGTRLTLRLYGAPGDLILSETVSGRLDQPPASAPEQVFAIARSGALSVFGAAGGREWQITALADAPPTVAPEGAVSRKADGRFRQGFRAHDDYGVTEGEVTIAPDLAAIPRRYGLAAEPDARAIAPVTLDLALPARGKRREVVAVLEDDLSKSVLSNLPVTLAFAVADGAGQWGRAEALHLTLPGRRFFDPLAAAIAEMRRDILWSRRNAARAAQVLKAVTWRPEDAGTNAGAYLRLRAVISRLDAAALPEGLSEADRDVLAEELWSIALLVEDGDLDSAREALRRAQDRLDEAIRRGADPAEIADLMQAMREALDDYLRELAENQVDGGQEGTDGAPQMTMSAEQLQQMLDRLQQLMDEGRMAEAAELMEELRRFMENMQVTEGEGGQGGPGRQVMRELQDTLRDQQDLSDDAFRDMQEGEGQGDALADRQDDLSRRLEDLREADRLPGPGSKKGEEGRRRLGDAGEAMDEAERALREGDLSGALDRQAEAMEALRNGLRDLGQALAEAEQQDGTGTPGRAEGDLDTRGLDPLGREPGNSLHVGSDENLLTGEEVERRAQELLDEIRRRAGEVGRDAAEKGYLGRLLDLF